MTVPVTSLTGSWPTRAQGAITHIGRRHVTHPPATLVTVSLPYRHGRLRLPPVLKPIGC